MEVKRIMNDMLDFLSSAILYVVLGFIYLKSYRLFNLNKVNDNVEVVITESLVVGFVLAKLFSLIPININVALDTVCMIITSALAGIVMAKIICSQRLFELLVRLGLRKTRNHYIWDDLIDNYAVKVMVIDYENNIIYDGKLVLFEEHNNRPQIILSEYTQYIGDELRNDFKGHPEQVVMIDTSKYKDILITFDSNSEVIKKWTVANNTCTTKK